MLKTLATDWVTYVQNILQPSFVGSFDVIRRRHLLTMPMPYSGDTPKGSMPFGGVNPQGVNHPKWENIDMKNWIHKFISSILSDVEEIAELNCEIIYQIRPKMAELSPEDWAQGLI